MRRRGLQTNRLRSVRLSGVYGRADSLYAAVTESGYRARDECERRTVDFLAFCGGVTLSASILRTCAGESPPSARWAARERSTISRNSALVAKAAVSLSALRRGTTAATGFPDLVMTRGSSRARRT